MTKPMLLLAENIPGVWGLAPRFKHAWGLALKQTQRNSDVTQTPKKPRNLTHGKL